MGKQVMRDVRLWLGGYDLSGDMNALSLDVQVATPEAPNLLSEAVARLPGLLDASFGHAGHFEAGTDQVDPTLWGKLGVADEVMTICPVLGAAEGEAIYTFQEIQGAYQPGARVGEVFAFEVSGNARIKPVRGTLMKNGTETVTGNGTGRNLGAVASGEKLYAALHVLSAGGAGPTLDVKVQSDADDNWLSPVDRITFSTASAKGAEWATAVDGPITDTWWRVVWTIGGAGPSFQFVAVVGIQ